MGRNLRNVYRTSKLKFSDNNIIQLKKDVDDVKNSLLNITAELNLVKNLVKATVEFDSDGGSSVATQYVVFRQKVTKPDGPTKTDYRFKAWYDGTLQYDFNAEVTENKELTAHWDALHTVTYAANGGTGDVPTQNSCIEGETFTVAENTLTKESKVFGGWSDGTSIYQPGSTYTVGSSNVTLTAVWNDEA